MKERSEEIACAVVVAVICEWLKYKNQGNDFRNTQNS